MSFDNEVSEKYLSEYGELVIKIGVNLQPDQLLVINSPITCTPLARAIAEAGYRAGAHDVTMLYSDELFSRTRFMLGRPDIFSEFPQWRRELLLTQAKSGAAFVSISAGDPEIFKSVEPDRLQMANMAAAAALEEYRERLMNNENSWCIVSAPTLSWAKKVFPGMDDKAAMDELWKAILSAVRVQGDGGAASRWQQHTDFLAKAAKWLNDNAFTELRYRNGLGTDLSVGLPKGHIWAGGAEENISHPGRFFVANMPTEEVYTAPDRGRVNGIVFADKPLVYEGNLIEGFSLTFKDGRVTDFRADKGENILKELLETDEGSARLGEVALVPYDSPISNSGILFYNTLFDENAACHLAFGRAYPTCLTGGPELSVEERIAHGINNSIVHEDFMIGTADLSIDGVREDGSVVPVFRQGNFVDFS